jgi:hypothetical protein
MHYICISMSERVRALCLSRWMLSRLGDSLTLTTGSFPFSHECVVENFAIIITFGNELLQNAADETPSLYIFNSSLRMPTDYCLVQVNRESTGNEKRQLVMIRIHLRLGRDGWYEQQRGLWKITTNLIKFPSAVRF